MDINNILIYDVGTGIYNTLSSSVDVYKSTIKGTVPIEYSTGLLTTTKSILDGSLHSVSGEIESAIINTTVLRPDYIDLSTNVSGCTGDDPRFVDASYGDFNILTGTSENTYYSSAIDLGGLLGIYDSDITSEINGFMLSENTTDHYGFLFQKNNNIIFSDYMREVKFAKLIHLLPKTVTYSYHYKQQTDIYNTTTIPSFSLQDNADNWPYDWDYVAMRTPEIINRNYIIPKSVIDITSAISSIGAQSAFNINNIKVKAFKNIEKRGVSFDYENSKQGRMIVWMIDNDQTLTMRDIYTGNDVEKYPLLTPPPPSGENIFIRPSGLIPYGNTMDGYKFMLERDTTTIIDGVDEYGNFEWFPIDKNLRYDLRGILAHKNNIYITAKYTAGTDSQPVLLNYPSRGYYVDYTNWTPSTLELSQLNSEPTDITVYEDGSIYVGDATLVSSGIYVHKYKLRYDYALQHNYDNNYIKYLLRESYNDVDNKRV